MDKGNQPFTLVLGLVSPIVVDHVRFTAEEKCLDLHVNFPRGSRFSCPASGQNCPVYDTKEKAWRNLDFFQRVVYLHARLLRACAQNMGCIWHPPSGRGNARDSHCSSRPWS